MIKARNLGTFIEMFSGFFDVQDPVIVKKFSKGRMNNRLVIQTVIILIFLICGGTLSYASPNSPVGDIAAGAGEASGGPNDAAGVGD